MNILIIFDHVFNDLSCLDEYFTRSEYNNNVENIFLYPQQQEPQQHPAEQSKYKQTKKKQKDFYQYFCDSKNNVNKLENVDELSKKIEKIDKVCIFVSGKDNKTSYDVLKDSDLVKDSLTKIPNEVIISTKNVSYVYFKDKRKTEPIENTYKKLGFASNVQNKRVQNKFQKMKKKTTKSSSSKSAKKEPPKLKKILKQENYCC